MPGTRHCAGLLLMKLLVKESKELVRKARGYRKEPTMDPDIASLLDHTQVSTLDSFRYLPPGVSPDSREATIDNETGRVM